MLESVLNSKFYEINYYGGEPTNFNQSPHRPVSMKILAKYLNL